MLYYSMPKETSGTGRIVSQSLSQTSKGKMDKRLLKGLEYFRRIDDLIGDSQCVSEYTV